MHWDEVLLMIDSFGRGGGMEFVKGRVFEEWGLVLVWDLGFERAF